MYRLPPHSDWNEFQWEAEIRKDELRISRYFTALAGCLDLPGEEDLIYRRLMAQPELVPTGVDANHADMRDIFGGLAFHEEDEEEADWDAAGDWRRKPGAEACRRVEYMAGEWNAMAAGLDVPEPMTEALAVSCLFGRLLSRVYNLTDDPGDTPPPLRVSLLKRVLADINDVLGALEPWCGDGRLPRERVIWLQEQLQHFREAAIDSLHNLRHQADGEWQDDAE